MTADANPNTNAHKSKQIELDIIDTLQRLMDEDHKHWQIVPIGNPFYGLDAVILDENGSTVGWIEIKNRKKDANYFQHNDLFAGIEKYDTAVTKDEAVWLVNRTADDKLLIYDLKCPDSTGALQGTYRNSDLYNQDDATRYRPALESGVFWDWDSLTSMVSI